MANSFMINVPVDFDLEYLGQKLRGMYQAKGFTVSMVSGRENLRIQFDKNCGGINMLMGLGKGITATCSLQNGCLVVDYSDGDWVGKIVGLVVGWILCFIPFITAIIGCIQQSELPKKISQDIMTIVNDSQTF